eukprot:PhM_4_TR5643/c0_g1_i1/m.65724
MISGLCDLLSFSLTKKLALNQYTTKKDLPAILCNICLFCFSLRLRAVVVAGLRPGRLGAHNLGGHAAHVLVLLVNQVLHLEHTVVHVAAALTLVLLVDPRAQLTHTAEVFVAAAVRRVEEGELLLREEREAGEDSAAQVVVVVAKALHAQRELLEVVRQKKVRHEVLLELLRLLEHGRDDRLGLVVHGQGEHLVEALERLVEAGGVRAEGADFVLELGAGVDLEHRVLEHLVGEDLQVEPHLVALHERLLDGHVRHQVLAHRAQHLEVVVHGLVVALQRRAELLNEVGLRQRLQVRLLLTAPLQQLAALLHEIFVRRRVLETHLSAARGNLVSTHKGGAGLVEETAHLLRGLLRTENVGRSLALELGDAGLQGRQVAALLGRKVVLRAVQHRLDVDEHGAVQVVEIHLLGANARKGCRRGLRFRQSGKLRVQVLRLGLRRDELLIRGSELLVELCRCRPVGGRRGLGSGLVGLGLRDALLHGRLDGLGLLLELLAGLVEGDVEVLVLGERGLLGYGDGLQLVKLGGVLIVELENLFTNGGHF